MITLKSCPVCKKNTIDVYPRIGMAPHVMHEIMPKVKIEASIISHYFICQSCHIIFQNPRMSDKELDKFYSLGVYRKLVNMTDKQMDEDEEFRAKVDANIISKYVVNIKSHLDMGSSRGYLLDLMGAKIKVGVEPNIKYSKEKNINVFSKIKNVIAKKFDLVTSIHNLEHVPDPLAYLKNMVKCVKRDGYVVIEVPTWKSQGGPLRLPHLYHFEPDVLRLICKQVGLKVVQIEFTPHLILICKLNN